jgi:MarR family transcriptional regulator, transcriptional regulator for hemolysin
LRRGCGTADCREHVLSIQQKKDARPKSSRRATSRRPKTKRWIAGVSAEGELLLRSRENDAADADGHIKYSFSQGLTFVARRWRNVMNEELQAVGQSHARWGTLYWIAVFGDRVNQTQLAERMGVEQPTLGRVLRDLEADGLIWRRAPRVDRRARVIGLTAESKPLMQKINRIQNSVRADLLKGIDPADLTACLAVFAKILENTDRRAATRR